MSNPNSCTTGVIAPVSHQKRPNQCRRPPDKRRPRQQVISPIVVEVCSDFQDVFLVNRQLLLPS